MASQIDLNASGANSAPVTIQASSVGTAAVAASTVSTAKAGPMTSAQLQKYQLNSDRCDKFKGSGRIRGLTARIYPQCGSKGIVADFLEVPCNLQDGSGIEIKDTPKTANIDSACVGNAIPYLTDRDVMVTINLNASGVSYGPIDDLLKGNVDIGGGCKRALGSSVEPYILELVDEVNGRRMIFPTAFLVAESDYKATSKAAPTGKIVFMIVKTADPASGQSYYSESCAA